MTKKLRFTAVALLAAASLLALAACSGADAPGETAPPPSYEPFVEEDASIKYYENKEHLSNVDFTSRTSYNLWRNGDYLPWSEEGRTVPTITSYLIGTEAARGCVVIFPGGGYAMRSNTEGEDVARYINEVMGMSAFVVNYRVAPNNYRAILSDALRAIRFVRFYAEDFNIDPEQITVLGFSAGGHLALMTAEHYDYGKTGDNIDAVSSRPDKVALCYPVVSMVSEYTHEESRANFLGGEDTEENRKAFSGELGIREDMPPVFVIACEDDGVVPIRNSYTLVEALEENGISCTHYWYQEGGHGFGLGSDLPVTGEWKTEFEAWLAQ